VDVGEAFDKFLRTIDADPEQLKLARQRVEAIRAAFNAEPDVNKVWSFGSLRRGTQLKPVSDVDVAVEYERAKHPDWGRPGKSAKDALSYVGGRVNYMLSATNGVMDTLVRLASPRDHAVKCFVDDPDDPEAFTVDVVPVLRQEDGTLLTPSARARMWSPADPENLILRVEKRQTDWSYFRPMVRMLKAWRLSSSIQSKITSLAMELLALECLPNGPTRAEALRTFFAEAAVRMTSPIEDLAGYREAIHPALDIADLRHALEEAAIIATTACAAEANGDIDEALRAWKMIFGTNFPEPDASLLPTTLASIPRVFLSYAHQDHTSAEELSRALGDRGFDVLLVDRNTIPETDVNAPVLDTIRTRDSFVVLLTSTVMANYWADEKIEAFDRRDIDVVPVLIQPGDLPAQLAHRSAVDMTPGMETTIDELISRIQQGATLDLLSAAPKDFECLAIELLQRRGFLITEPKETDQEFDFLVSYRDPLGLVDPVDYVVEVKTYVKSRASIETMKTFAAAVDRLDGNKRGLLITNARLTSVARQALEEINIKRDRLLRVLDGPQVKSLLLENPELAHRYRPGLVYVGSQ
jgi:hypothetical protein